MLAISYNYSMEAGDSLLVENDGEFALEFLGEHGNSYAIVKTLLGLTTVFFWGPLVPEAKWLDSHYVFNFERFKFSKSRISQKMSEYANSRTLKNYQINVVTEEYARKFIRDDLNYYLEHYKEIEDEFANNMGMDRK